MGIQTVWTFEQKTGGQGSSRGEIICEITFWPLAALLSIGYEIRDVLSVVDSSLQDVPSTFYITVSLLQSSTSATKKIKLDILSNRPKDFADLGPQRASVAFPFRLEQARKPEGAHITREKPQLSFARPACPHPLP